jgi:hypothetical protein
VNSSSPRPFTLRLPPVAHLVLPQRILPWTRFVHVAHRSLSVTLCGRVRVGDEVLAPPPDFSLCRRCVYRAGITWTYL